MFCSVGLVYITEELNQNKMSHGGEEFPSYYVTACYNHKL